MSNSILIVDDEPDIVDLVALNLTTAGYDCQSASHADEAMDMALRIRPDLIVLDRMLPGIDGVEVCRRVRKDSRTAGIGIIMLSARTLSSDRIEGLGAGADDYIDKPFNPSELVARVETTLRRGRQLRASSPLTGLPGNFEIEQHMEVLIASGLRFAVLHVDLDEFKAFNDRYGFVRGDRAIVLAAQVISAAAVATAATSGRPPFIGHIGGDDFVVVCHPGQAEQMATDIISGFDANVADLYDPEDRERGVIDITDRSGLLHAHALLSISIGIASSDVRPFASATEAAAVATELKRYAKAVPGSVWRIDHRHENNSRVGLVRPR